MADAELEQLRKLKGLADRMSEALVERIKAEESLRRDPALNGHGFQGDLIDGCDRQAGEWAVVYAFFRGKWFGEQTVPPQCRPPSTAPEAMHEEFRERWGTGGDHSTRS